MNPGIITSRAAEEDLADVWNFIAKDSEYHAERFIRYVDGRLQHLARHPLIGRPRRELAEGLRSFLVRHLVVYYRSLPVGIEVVRVLHTSRDIRAEMFRA